MLLCDSTFGSMGWKDVLYNPKSTSSCTHDLLYHHTLHLQRKMIRNRIEGEKLKVSVRVRIRVEGRVRIIGVGLRLKYEGAKTRLNDEWGTCISQSIY